nr:alpha/beta fold hydrolase [Prescottella agglutinans]
MNDWTCSLTPEHPRPVVLAHGTGMSWTDAFGEPGSATNDAGLAKELLAAGYCVYAENYGGTSYAGLPGITGITWGNDNIGRSAKQAATFVDTVLARTNSSQVDIVAHSQGGTMARQYLRFEGGANPNNPALNKVHTLVMVAPSTHGSTLEDFEVVDQNGLLVTLDVQQAFDTRYPTWLGETVRYAAAVADPTVGPAVYQQFVGSKFLATLNAGSETLPGVHYTVIASNLWKGKQNDGIITPKWDQSFLKVAAGDPFVENITVQDACPGLPLSHTSGLLNHPAPQFLVKKALDPTLGGTPPCAG